MSEYIKPPELRICDACRRCAFATVIERAAGLPPAIGLFCELHARQVHALEICDDFEKQKERGLNDN